MKTSGQTVKLFDYRQDKASDSFVPNPAFLSSLGWDSIYVVLDEWLEAVTNITIPMYLFFGGADPFIPSDRLKQIDSRFKELNKEYKLKIYPEAEHGFFCQERSS